MVQKTEDIEALLERGIALVERLEELLSKINANLEKQADPYIHYVSVPVVNPVLGPTCNTDPQIKLWE